jgi:hypothetical protein
MDYLVYCPCGHTVSRHEAKGCNGDRRVRCACRLTRWEALDAAVDEVRTEGWIAVKGAEAVPITFEEFIRSVYARLRTRIPDVELRAHDECAVCAWRGGSVVARPVGEGECAVTVHSDRLHASAEARFKIREETSGAVAKFAFLLRDTATLTRAMVGSP